MADNIVVNFLVTITEPDWQALKKLGNGNASAGIREAVRLAYVQVERDALA